MTPPLTEEDIAKLIAKTTVIMKKKFSSVIEGEILLDKFHCSL